MIAESGSGSSDLVSHGGCTDQSDHDSAMEMGLAVAAAVIMVLWLKQ